MTTGGIVCRIIRRDGHPVKHQDHPHLDTRTTLAASTNEKQQKRTIHKRANFLLVLLAVCSFLVCLDQDFLDATRDAHRKEMHAGEYHHKTIDPDTITHVYRLGHNHDIGRFNNEWIAIMHAIERAQVDHGDRAVVALGGWAPRTFQKLFFDQSLENELEFQVRLETTGLVVHESRLEALGLTEKHNKTQVWLNTKETYYWVRNHFVEFSPDEIRRRRQMVLRIFLQQIGIHQKNLVLYNRLIQHIQERQRVFGGVNTKNAGYIAIHSRWLEGECERRVGNLLPKDECWMTPSYIKDILGGTIDKPIVVIWDGQKPEVIETLRRDPEIGPALIVAEDIVPKDIEIPQPLSDFAIGVMSDVFIGARVSSFAANIGVFREALGADPTTNKIYTSPGKFDKDGKLEVCEDCLYLCDKNKSN